MHRPLVSTLVCLALAASLVACSSPTPPAASPTGPVTPQISVSEAPSPSPSAKSPDLDTALDFVKAIYLDKTEDAGQYVADNSTAARYVTHRLAIAEVDSNNADDEEVDASGYDFDLDKAKKTITIETEDETIVWQDFAFTGGKVSSWEVKGEDPLDERLWHAKATDESKGVKARLVSAYEAVDGGVQVVVDLSSKKDVTIWEASYTPSDGYRRKDAAALTNDIDKDGKLLTYFLFNKSRLGGKIKLEVNAIDPDDSSSSTDLTTLTLKVS